MFSGRSPRARARPQTPGDVLAVRSGDPATIGGNSSTFRMPITGLRDDQDGGGQRRRVLR